MNEQRLEFLENHHAILRYKSISFPDFIKHGCETSQVTDDHKALKNEHVCNGLLYTLSPSIKFEARLSLMIRIAVYRIR